jgi:hypothetical protein
MEWTKASESLMVVMSPIVSGCSVGESESKHDDSPLAFELHSKVVTLMWHCYDLALFDL